LNSGPGPCQALYWLSHIPAPFCFSYSSDRVSHTFYFAQTTYLFCLDHGPPTCLPSSWDYRQERPHPISTSQVAGITGKSCHPWPLGLVSYFSNRSSHFRPMQASDQEEDFDRAQTQGCNTSLGQLRLRLPMLSSPSTPALCSWTNWCTHEHFGTYLSFCQNCLEPSSVLKVPLCSLY
jgi:hypothetical protein